MDSPLDEIEFLARSDHRVGVLDALAEGPRDRDELRATTGASSPTVGRILGDYEERHWSTRDGRTYELTRLGEFVAARFMDLREAMETERKLRDVVPWLPREMEGFTVELFADATVSYPGPGYPYQPVERVTQLIEGTDSMRGFGTTVVKSSNLEAACRAILEGMEFEFIYSPSVLETIVEWDPEKVAAVDACENCTTFLHHSLPDSDWCVLGISDDRVGICCHDVETGMLKAVVDTDSPAAVAWAESVYERYRDEARPIDEDADLVARSVCFEQPPVEAYTRSTSSGIDHREHSFDGKRESVSPRPPRCRHGLSPRETIPPGSYIVSPTVPGFWADYDRVRKPDGGVATRAERPRRLRAVSRTADVRAVG